MGQPQKDFKIVEQGIEAKADLIKEYKVGTAMANIIPWGVEVRNADRVEITNDLFQYLYSVRQEIEREAPFIMSGLPMGTSGRHQDEAMVSAMRKYETVVENTENSFSLALGMALRIIDNPAIGVYPEELRKGDLRDNYDLIVKLKAGDPIEQDRKATLGSRLYQAPRPEIDLRTDLVDYQGKTPNEADDIITNILVDLVTLNNPEVAAVMGRAFAKEAGFEEYFEELRQERMLAMQQQAALGALPPTQNRQGGEVKSNLSREIIDQSLRNEGVRRPPTRT